MTAYAVAQIHSVEFGPDIVEYLQRIDETLDPFGGHFLVHGSVVDTIEGRWGAGGLILIEFPDRKQLDDWYHSAAYQEILPLRTKHMVADVAFAQGVPDGYRGADALNH